jgi:hypothetical protein
MPTAILPLALVAAAAVTLGAALHLLPARSAGAQQTELVIEILPDGFNPAECMVNRNARIPIHFVNRDTKPRRVVIDLLYEPEPGGFAFDTGWIAPGETNRFGWVFNEIQDLTYRDHDDPSLTGKIIVPMSKVAPTFCERQAGSPPPAADPCTFVFSEAAGCSVLPNVTRN